MRTNNELTVQCDTNSSEIFHNPFYNQKIVWLIYKGKIVLCNLGLQFLGSYSLSAENLEKLNFLSGLPISKLTIAAKILFSF